MRKILIGLLVLAMVASVVVGFLAYLPQVNPKNQDPFADVPYPSIQSFRFADLAGQDVTEVDLSLVTDTGTLTFDSATKWPAADKMPEGFSPEVLLKEARYLGLGLRGLHDRGITGKGISVAVIDRPMLKDHEEFADNIEYIEVSPGDANQAAVNFHGTAITGILAGKNGVAPGAHVYYYAIPNDDNAYATSAQAMDKIIELNRTLPAGEKIRIVASAQSANPLDEAANVGGAKDWSDAIKRAQDAGIIVVYAGMPELDFTGAGAVPGKDRDDPQNYRPWTWTTAKAWVVQKLKDANANSWESARKELIRLLTEQPDLDSLQAEALNTYIYLTESYKQTSTFDAWFAVAPGVQVSEALAIPVDCITIANVDGADTYTYYGSGGLSWATPYIAGLMALGLQVEPSVVPADLFKALNDTGTPFATGGKLVNPAGFIQALK
ncbi:MAG: S8 family serine peptidase [Bacillota bacterium]